MNEDVKIDLISIVDNLSGNMAGNDAICRLVPAVRFLIEHDFPKLIDVLYRMDVDEKKLKAGIAKNAPEDSAIVIARMLLERQRQKKMFRESFKFPSSEISEEDKW